MPTLYVYYHYDDFSPSDPSAAATATDAFIIGHAITPY